MSKFRVAIFRPAALVIGAFALILTGTAQAQLAQMSTPTPGTTFPGAAVTFTWTAGDANAQQYYLYVGSVFGGNDLYGASQALNTTATVGSGGSGNNPLPTDGRILWVRLWTFIGGNSDLTNGWHFLDYQYLAFNSNITCGPLSKAALSIPTPGTMLPGTSVTFSWAGNSCITGYKLGVSLTGAGLSDFFSTSTANQSQLVAGLPSDGTTTVFVRLTSTIGGIDYFTDYTYTAFTASAGGCAAPLAAVLIPPPAFGSQLAGASQTFAWGPGCGVTDYYLYVGSAFGTNDLFGQDELAHTTAAGGSDTVGNLPVDSRTLYVRLWSLINGIWNFNDYTYKASGNAGGCGTPSPATLTTPAPGSTLTGSSATFTWTSNSASCVTPFTLAIGNEVGGSEIFLSSGLGSATTVTVNSLPTDGRTLFVRLSTQIGGVNQFIDYTYLAFTVSAGCGAPSPATMTTPTPGLAPPLAGASVTFTWSTGCGVTEYYLYVGTSFSANNLYSLDQGAKLTATVNNLPTDGSKLYVRLWSLINGIWQFNDYTYTASGAGAGCGAPTAATMSSPTPGTMLPAASVTFIWNAGSCVVSYVLSVGRTTGGTDFYGPTSGATLSAAVNNLPADGATTVFVRLTTMFTGGTSQSNDYTYTAFSNAAGCGTAALATMSSPTPGSTLAGASVTFSWTSGCNITQYYLYAGTAVGANNIFGVSEGNSMTATVINLPTNASPVYVRLWSYVGAASSSFSIGWHFLDYVYTAAGSNAGCGTPAVATMTSPTPGTTLPGASVVFTWNLGACVTTVTISVGSSQGASDIFQAVQGVSVTASVNTLPTSGQTVYVRLTSTFTGGGTQSVDYTYTAATTSAGCGAVAVAATMLNPTPGSTLPANPVTFSWTAGCNVAQYYLYLGTVAGGNDLYGQSQGTSLSGMVTVQATSGQTIFVRIWSLLNTAASDLTVGWHSNDSTYIAH